MVLYKEKATLLFSFATNTVKMCGFVEPAHTRFCCVAGITRVFALV